MTIQRIKIKSRLGRAFLRREDGSTTVLAIFFLLMVLVMGGLAIDFNHLMARRTQLQVAADAVAHAALYTRETESASDAKVAALDVAEIMLPGWRNGESIRLTDIEFGSWDPDARAFDLDQNSKAAVRVSAQRLEERQNAVSSFLLRMIGFDNFDVRRASVFSTYLPTCFTEGFVAEDVVDIQSNNSYFNGFCLHSNNYVSLNSNNFFEPGTIVSMPDSSQVDLPQSGFQTNEGLSLALRDGAYRLRIINRLEEMIDSLRAGDGTYVPDNIIGSGLLTVSSKKAVVPTDFTPGRKHRITCSGGNALKFDGQLFSDFLLVTDCKVQFGAGAILEDVVIANTNTSLFSFKAPADLQLGRNDNCAEGGGAVLLTKGGVNIANGLSMFGSQILALDDVEFTANANGIQGASVISGATISGTSNMSMGHCAHQGMERIYTADYFRMVN